MLNFTILIERTETSHTNKTLKWFKWLVIQSRFSKTLWKDMQISY